jgi:Cu/Ag efflux protein CusF
MRSRRLSLPSHFQPHDLLSQMIGQYDPETHGVSAMTTIKPLDLDRRRVIASALACALVPLARLHAATSTPMEVWTGPSCSCCHDWIAHLQANGFAVTTHDGGNTDARNRLGMPVQYGSCHTGAVLGYAIEGHVPATEIRRLLEERPDAIGLSVPAMPRGSPGMDGPVYGGAQDPYDVLLIQRDGRSVIYRSYRSSRLNEGQRQSASHSAEGVLTAIDAAAGRVTISHGAIASVGWPAMTMSFTLADPKAATGLAPGQRVAFDFTVEGGMTATVTRLTRAE